LDHAIPILLYHSIGQTANAAYGRWTVGPQNFAAQIRFFLDRGYTALTISQLVQMRHKGQLPAKAFAITFDDGLRDFLTDAVPVLQACGVPATLYVAAGFVGETAEWLTALGEGSRSMLTWAELNHVKNLGVEIGAHTMTHPALDVLPVVTATLEIQESKQVLENNLTCKIRSLAYPHGYSSKLVRRIAQESGFNSACRVRHAFSSSSENIFALSRIIMTNSLQEVQLEAMMQERTLPVSPPADRLVADGWRMMRKVQHHMGIELWR
jgi:peptidoglycan/xylan/chitin deacetylase (PgdA/CDA1 family)